MSLKEEIELNRDFENHHEAAVLALVHTTEALMQLSSSFLAAYELTTTQFNALMIIRDYEEEGIMQFELSRRLLINRASTGTLIDKLEDRGLLQRRRCENDRRAFNLELSIAAHELLAELLPEYYQRVGKIFAGINPEEVDQLLDLTASVRKRVRDHLCD